MSGLPDIHPKPEDLMAEGVYQANYEYTVAYLIYTK